MIPQKLEDLEDLTFPDRTQLKGVGVGGRLALYKQISPVTPT